MTAGFGSVTVTVSNEAFEMVPIFPDKPNTKRRRRRTLGKYGRTERLNPLAFNTPFGLVVHPILFEKLKEKST